MSQMTEHAFKDPYHGLTYTKFFFGPDEFGPLGIFYAEYRNNFSKIGYYVTTPKFDTLKLRRVVLGSKEDDIQYWTIDSSRGSVNRSDGLNKEEIYERGVPHSLIVPQGILLYEGRSRLTLHGVDSDWLVFIPRIVVQPLLHVQRTLRYGRDLDHVDIIINYSEQCTKAQTKVLLTWYSLYVKEKLSLEKSKDMLRYGNCLDRVPLNIRTALTAAKSGMLSSNKLLPSGQYLIHKDWILSPDGAKQHMTLYARVDYVHSRNRIYRIGQSSQTAISHYFNVSLQWTPAIDFVQLERKVQKEYAVKIFKLI